MGREGEDERRGCVCVLRLLVQPYDHDYDYDMYDISLRLQMF